VPPGRRHCLMDDTALIQALAPVAVWLARALVDGMLAPNPGMAPACYAAAAAEPGSP
jgi:hypothetical protein